MTYNELVESIVNYATSDRFTDKQIAENFSVKFAEVLRRDLRKQFDKVKKHSLIPIEVVVTYLVEDQRRVCSEFTLHIDKHKLHQDWDMLSESEQDLMKQEWIWENLSADLTSAFVEQYEI